MTWVRLRRFVMTWAYLTSRGVTVDLYTRPDEISWLSESFGVPIPPEPGAEDSVHVLWLDDVQVAASSPSSISSGRTPRAPVPDPTPPGQLARSARENADQIARELFETAPDSDVRIAGRPVRGRWVPADLLGSTPGALLLGVLPEDLAPDEIRQVATRLRSRRLERGRFTATMHDRLVVAYAPDLTGQPWHLVDNIT
ncbi:hypothetical protein [Lentzea sp. CA-135723]|uniref:hypothetical protein n=1 Tax=Lentzea sp. CA-135723 TaxID=3239950 RepID=UPI003D8BC054